MSRNRASRSNALVTNRLRLSRCVVGPCLCVCEVETGPHNTATLISVCDIHE